MISTTQEISSFKSSYIKIDTNKHKSPEDTIASLRTLFQFSEIEIETLREKHPDFKLLILK